MRSVLLFCLIINKIIVWDSSRCSEWPGVSIDARRGWVEVGFANFYPPPLNLKTVWSFRSAGWRREIFKIKPNSYVKLAFCGQAVNLLLSPLFSFFFLHDVFHVLQSADMEASEGRRCNLPPAFRLKPGISENFGHALQRFHEPDSEPKAATFNWPPAGGQVKRHEIEEEENLHEHHASHHLLLASLNMIEKLKI